MAFDRMKLLAFQSHAGSIEVRIFQRGEGPRSLWCFNPTLVRLRCWRCKHLFAYFLGFNPTLVRLRC